MRDFVDAAGRHVLAGVIAEVEAIAGSEPAGFTVVLDDGSTAALFGAEPEVGDVYALEAPDGRRLLIPGATFAAGYLEFGASSARIEEGV
jgi:hypothetical protein